MTPKEFQSAGKPVVVPDEPNLRNQVTDGVDGVVVPASTAGVREGVEPRRSKHLPRTRPASGGRPSPTMTLPTCCTVGTRRSRRRASGRR
jgi:hypothetical protein